MSQGIHSTRRDLILEPLAGSWYDESRFSGGNLMASFTPQESQGILHHTVGFWPWPLLWLQICKYAKRQRAKGRKCRPKGRATRAAALYSPFLYSLSKSKPQPKVNAYSACNEQITVGTAVSPHGPGATNPVRNRLVAGMFDHFWAGYPNSPANYIKFCNRL